MSDDLHEQVNRAIEPALAAAHFYGANPEQRHAAIERVLAVFAERERVLREHIAALPHGPTVRDFKLECDRKTVYLDDVLAVFDA